MFKRLITILSLVLIIAIVISIGIAPIYSYAIPTVAVAALGGAAALIGTLIGVDYLSNNFSIDSNINFFNKYVPTTGYIPTDFILDIISNPQGTVSAFINKAAFDYLKDTNSNVITDYNIQDNSQGNLKNYTGTFAGIPVNSTGSTDYFYLNTPVSSVTIGNMIIESYQISYGYKIRLKTTSESTWTILSPTFGQVNYPFRLNFYNISGTTATLGMLGANGYTNSARYTFDQGYVASAETLDYVSNNIDLTVGSSIPSTGGVTFTYTPTTASTDPEDIIVDFTEQWLNDPTAVTIQLVNDEPVPPQPLPTTPLGNLPYDEWYDLFGNDVISGLDQLFNDERMWHDVINQAFEDAGYTDTSEGITDLIGLQTDIDENLQDGIVYLDDISDDTDTISTELTNVGNDVEDIKDDVVVIVDDLGNVIDVLEGVEAQEYINGQTLSDIDSTTTSISTEVSDIGETLDDVKDAIIPITDIATDVQTLSDTLTDVATDVDTLTDVLPDIATLPDIKTTTETIQDTLTDTLPDIITTIQDSTTTITDDIPNIDDICLNIDEAPLKDAETGVDRIPRLILPYITDLRSALGIWHYVVTWTGQINSVFSWLLGVLTGTAIMTPIYAAVAGYIVIHVYRRMCN